MRRVAPLSAAGHEAVHWSTLGMQEPGKASSVWKAYAWPLYCLKQLRQLIEDLQTGGLAIIWWGLAWLLIGGILGGLAPEVASVVKRMHEP